jgi:nitroimidazol reductase NimA-like FMN-containing flavoprotein (pyridoxamine 5'-phosphate oxidase superfamily)
MTTLDAGKVTILDPLTPAECWAKLSRRAVGRVALVVDGRPAIFPVNYAIDGESIVFRTAEGSALTEASLRTVAFEVDDYNEITHSGWSVLVRGLAHDIGDALDDTSERLRRLPLDVWAPGTRQRWFHVQPDEVSGRLLRVLPEAL